MSEMSPELVIILEGRLGMLDVPGVGWNPVDVEAEAAAAQAQVP